MKCRVTVESDQKHRNQSQLSWVFDSKLDIFVVGSVVFTVLLPVELSVQSHGSPVLHGSFEPPIELEILRWAMGLVNWFYQTLSDK